MKIRTILLLLTLLTSFSMASLFAQKSSEKGCMVVGHRGSSRTAPENTMASAKLAWEQGADAVEVDVHLSSDNKIVVIHDKGTKRTSGVDLEVSKTPYKRLKELDVGSWKNEQYKGEAIPLLEDIVSIIPEGKLLVVEIKSDKKVVPFIKEAFQSHPKADQLIFIAFSYEAIVDAKRAFPNNKSFWLSSSAEDVSGKDLKKIKADGLDGVDLNHKIIDEDLINLANSIGLEVHTWTVNNIEKAEKLKAMGVKSITTDIPDLVLKAIQ